MSVIKHAVRLVDAKYRFDSSYNMHCSPPWSLDACAILCVRRPFWWNGGVARIRVKGGRSAKGMEDESYRIWGRKSSPENFCAVGECRSMFPQRKSHSFCVGMRGGNGQCQRRANLLYYAYYMYFTHCNVWIVILYETYVHSKYND